MPCCSATTMCRAACHGHLASLRISRRSEKTRDISHTSKDVFYNRGKKLLGLTLCSGLRLFWIHRALVHCVLLNLKNKNFCSIKFDPPPLPKGHVCSRCDCLACTHTGITRLRQPLAQASSAGGWGRCWWGLHGAGGRVGMPRAPCKELPSKQCDCLCNKAV